MAHFLKRRIALALVPVLLLLLAVAAWGADDVQLVVTPAPAVVAPADAMVPVYLKIAVRVPARADARDRLPVNVCLLLDASASMAGEKARRAREAAAAAVERLLPGDTVSVVTYASTVRVLVPAVRLHDAAPVTRALDGMTVSGDTAIFAGLSKAAGELMKFREPSRVNRIVLLSDGRANVGPGGTADLVRLAESLRCDGITISTIGLGSDYFEDLMLQLALAGGGNHYYAATPEELTDIFQHEFTESVDAAAKDVSITMDFGDAAQPVLALGHQPQLMPRKVLASLGPLFAGQEKYVIVEAQVKPVTLGRLILGNVTAQYTAARTGETITRTAEVTLDVVPPEQADDVPRNPAVLEAFVRQVGAEKNRMATDLLDAGRRDEAAAWLRQNADQLADWAERLDSAVLREDARRNRGDAEAVARKDIVEQRKSMRFYQNAISNQSPSLPSKSIGPGERASP